MPEVVTGSPIPPWRLDSVDGQAMKTMALLLHDPNPIHFDEEAVRAVGMGDRVVNQGPTNLGYVVNMLLAWSEGGAGSIRRVTTRFLGNVFAGDALTASGRVVDVADVDGVRVATCEVWLDRDDGTRLITGTAEVEVGP